MPPRQPANETPRASGQSSPLARGRGRRWWAIGLLALAIASLAGFALVRMNELSAEREADRLSVSRISALANSVSAHEWQAVAEGGGDDGLHASLALVLDDLDAEVALFRSREGSGSDPLIATIESYKSAVIAEFEFFRLGELEKAEEVDEELVDPLFDRLKEEADVAAASAERSANDYRDVAEIGSVVTLVVALLLMATLAWLSRRTAQREAVLQARHQTLEDSEGRFRSLVLNSSDLILIVDERGTIGYASPSVSQITGKSGAVLRGASLVESVHSSDQQALLDSLSEETGSLQQVDFRLKGADGSWHQLASDVRDLRSDPRVGGVVLNARDVTEEEILRADLRQMEHFNQMKSEFVSMVSHELRTPLTGILGFAELVEASPGLSDQERGWVGIVRTEGGNLSAIIDDLLDLSRIESGRLTLNAERVAADDVVSEVLARYEPVTDTHRFISEGEAGAIVAGDGKRLVQVLSNLVDNAVKYSPDGGTITVRTDRQAGALRVSVRDEGIGIPKAARATLFQRFGRIERAEAVSVRSTGLGLYIVKHLVTQMGGEVSVETELGVGSTFSFTVPLANAGRSEAA